MNRKTKKLALIFIIINVILVLLMENTDGMLQNSIGMIWASIDFLLVCSYLFWGAYNVYIVYDYYSMRSYISNLDIKICRDYIRHKNVYDILEYTWEEIEENRFIIMFPYQIVRGNQYVSQVVAGVEYQVNLYETEKGTEITCMFMKSRLFHKPILPWYIDKFIEQKFKAQYQNVNYNMGEEQYDNMV